MAKNEYTMQDLEQARAELQQVHDAWDRYSGNNPNKYKSGMAAAAAKVDEIERALKDNGTIPLTDHEKVERELDRLHPNAESKLIVDHNGKRYQRWYLPAEKSKSGKTVHRWHSGWKEIDEDGSPIDK